MIGYASIPRHRPKTSGRNIWLVASNLTSGIHCIVVFHLIVLESWKLVDVWTSYFGIMVQYDRTFHLKINVVHCDLYFMVQWFCLISPRLFDGWVSSDNETVWPKLWPQNKYRSTWPIFHIHEFIPYFCSYHLSCKWKNKWNYIWLTVSYNFE